MNNIDYLLESSPWVKNLNDTQVERVRSTMRSQSYAAGALVCHRGDQTAAWVGVCDGIVKLGVSSQNGKQVSLATGIPKGSWFGEGSLLKREPRKYDVIALRKSVVAFMPEETFFWLLDESIHFNQFLLNQLNERLGQFIGHMENQRLLSPEARVARSLASMFHPQLYPCASDEIKLSQQELGSLSGISRQRVNKALSVLQEQKIIDIEYSTIRVLDFDALQNFSHEEA